MKNYVFVFFLSVLCASNAQDSYNTATILDSVAVSNTKIENFALYLPRSYNAEVPSPIVFIFEPVARGRIGISPFISAAEKYGYILVCSNNSRNGPYDRNLDIAGRLFDHVFASFNIDTDRVFLSGFSGGSRLASAIATLSNGITGVIACGAGLSTDPRHVPYDKDFLYVGVCGDRDMNYMELNEVMVFLDRLNFKKTMFTFNGVHQWPPEEEILRAFDWLQLELHQKGVLRLDEKQLKRYYTDSYSRAEDALIQENFLQAAEDLERVRQSFAKTYMLDSITQKIGFVKGQKKYKQQKASTSKAFEKERILTAKYNEKINEAFQDPQKVKIAYWEKEIGKLGKLKEKGGLEIQKMVDRLSYKLFANFYSRINPNLSFNVTGEQTIYAKRVIALFRENASD